VPKLARNPVNRQLTNEAAIERACKQLRERLLSEIRINPDLYGSVAATVQIHGGVIDRFRVTADSSEKIEAITA
jgi:hypothetical protein